ncbi:MAG: T9SS type A sorting domain-containing protein, partial [Bacteroidetes bacterium]|nr:T9SS type A sorting domain-containing protein [Bacteroidota bacterium]
EIGFAARFDGDGNNLWYKEYPGNLGMSGMYCVDNGDGTYQYVQNWWTRIQGDANDIMVGRMDTLGNILTSKRLGKINRMQFAQGLLKTQDGNFYVSGIGYFSNFHSYGFKFSPQGDSLWYRTYHHDDSLDLAYVESFKEDGAGNLVHFGYHGNNVNPNPGNGIFAWLYRTDEHGCIFQDCHLSQEEIAALPKLSLYPNPSKGRFYIEIEASQDFPCVLEIYNTDGALLESHSLVSPYQSRLVIDTPLNPGHYFVLLRDKQGTELALSKLLLID